MFCFRFLILLTLAVAVALALSPPVTPSSTSEIIQAVVTRLDSKRASASAQESAAEGVLKRLLPPHARSFEFKIISKDACGGVSCFIISNYNSSSEDGPEIMISGNTAVELASGLHWYLKYWCGAHVSWDKTGGVQLASVPKPGSLPQVKEGGVMIQRPVPWNYYQNVVTSSYSYVWWDWTRWEKEIDWMALQGINLPLAFTGQEAIWQKVFMEFNITSEELNNFFGGPAFLAWARMGNLHGKISVITKSKLQTWVNLQTSHRWGGPLSQNWLDQQLKLQKQILNRMLELGMTPVLPSFSGNVPAALTEIYPSANITRLGDWNTVNGNKTWCCTFLLNPSDPLFVEIGEAFIKKQVEEYGDVTDIYNCDTFNENLPPTDDTTYISSLGAAVYKAMSRGDKDAIWLMQGWLFYSSSNFWKPPQMQALLHSVPVGKMIVLDLFADVKPIWNTSSQFYGTPYIWCLLHNFGGNIEMYGLLDSVASGPIDARTSENSTMVGVGMCMEGIEHNPVVYELMSEMAFRNERVHVSEWIKSYSRRRYGKSVDGLEAAWQILYQTIYNCTDGIANHNTDFIVKFPQWSPSTQEQNLQIPSTLSQNRRALFEATTPDIPQPHLWYRTETVIPALKMFIDAGTQLNGSLTYRYDLVDLTRQVLSKLANQVYMDALNAYLEKDATSLHHNSKKFTQLIEDIDELLAADDNLLLGTWLESAKSLAQNPTDMMQYEWNARTQVTMWFDNTETLQSPLHDYANKFWSGLLEDYYLPRAASYFGYLLKSLEEEKEFVIEVWEREWIAYSNKWQAGDEIYPVKAKGDALQIATTLYSKYFT